MGTIRKISVFIASPGDVDAERTAIASAIEEINLDEIERSQTFLELIKWETHTWPGFGQDAQDVINSQIGDFDIFVGIFWNRLGTPTKRGRSGTVEEFERAYKSWQSHHRPSLFFYFKEAPANLSKEDDLTQKIGVVKFKKELRKLGAYTQDFSTTDEFHKLIRRHLTKQITSVNSLKPAPAPAGPDKSSARMDDKIRKLSYWHLGATRNLLDQIEEETADAPLELRKVAVEGLLAFLMTGLPGDDKDTILNIRAVRRQTFHLIRQIASTDVVGYLNNGEFEGMDMVQFDLSKMQLFGTSFNASFAVEADFRLAKLDKSSMRGAWIRNANFADASLDGVDMSDADWFNALNLSEAQLRSVKRGTLALMPSTTNELHAFLKKRYGLPFEIWTEDVRDNLTSAWREYAKPNGLASIVAGLA